MKTVIHLENKNDKALPDAFRDDDVRFTESLVAHFLGKYTREGDVVFDPFAGFGTTLVTAEKMGRVPLGMEYDGARVRYIRSRLHRSEAIIHGDARQLARYGLPRFDFSITSPPYMKRGDIENPFTAYEARGEGYEAYLCDLCTIYEQMADLMKPDARVVIEAANIKSGDGVTTLAWDIAREVSQVLHFEGEVIVDWDQYGYGYSHSYCLVFSE